MTRKSRGFFSDPIIKYAPLPQWIVDRSGWDKRRVWDKTVIFGLESRVIHRDPSGNPVTKRKVMDAMRLIMIIAVWLLVGAVAAQDDARDLNGFPLPALEIITRENVERIEYLARIGNGTAYDMAVSPDGTVYIASSIGIWIVPESGSPVPIELTPVPITQLALHPNGTLLAAGGDDGTIRLYDLTQGALIPGILEAHLYTISALEFADDGERLGSGDIGGVMRVWEVEGERGREVSVHDYGFRITDIHFYDTSAAAQLGIGNDAFIQPLTPSMNADTAALEQGFWAHPEYVAIDQHTLTALVRFLSTDAILTIDRATGDVVHAERYVVVDHNDEPISLTSPSGEFAVVAGHDVIVLTHADQTTTRLFGHHRYITSLQFSQDERLLFSASLDMTINVYDATVTGEAGALLTLTGHNGGVTDLAMSGDGTLLASSSYDGTIRLWGVIGR